MKSFAFLFIVALALVASAKTLPNISRAELQSNTWVLLAAGATGWDNYRMQADVCHAYHVFHERLGIPDERIIVMMYDDIANCPQNPYPGKIINDINGQDVYAGVPHDLTGESVTADNFVTLMTGGSVPGCSKTIKATSEDNIFVYFSDHGGMYALCFPHQVLSYTMMQTALDTMASKNMFKNLILYTDACYSGSVFFKLNIPANTYVATAAPVGEYAYSCDYDNNLRNFPCDRFSHAWMTDIEQNNKPGYTWGNEFDYVQTHIDYSQSCCYGAIDQFRSKTINSFFNLPDLKEAPGAHAGKIQRDSKKGGVAQFDVPLVLAQRVYEQERTEENRLKLEKELRIRKTIDKMSDRIVAAAKPGLDSVSVAVCEGRCDNSCPCFDFCLKEHDASFCSAECCNENQACYSTPPRGNAASIFESCLEALSIEYMQSCGVEHGYLRKTDGIFYRLCKRESVNVAAAINEIHKQCSWFKNITF